MKFEDVKIHGPMTISIMQDMYYISYDISHDKYGSGYVYKDGIMHEKCGEEKDSDGWFESYEEAEEAVLLYVKKQNKPNKPTRGIIATWLYNRGN